MAVNQPQVLIALVICLQCFSLDSLSKKIVFQCYEKLAVDNKIILNCALEAMKLKVQTVQWLVIC